MAQVHAFATEHVCLPFAAIVVVVTAFLALLGRQATRMATMKAVS